MTKQGIKSLNRLYERKISSRNKLFELFDNTSVPNKELLLKLGLFSKRQSLSWLLFMRNLYQKIINIYGSVVELSIRYGKTLARFITFKNVHKPYNHTQIIAEFNTFERSVLIDLEDWESNLLSKYSLTEKHEEYLEEILQHHE